MTEAALGMRLRALGSAPPGLALIGDRLLDLGTTTNQARFINELPEGGVLVLDGLSLLVPPSRGGAMRWRGVCAWLRMLRQDGAAVVLVDPAPRPQVEALADTLVTLRPVRDAERVAFAAEIVSRHAVDAADRAFTVRLDLADGAARWTRAAAADPVLEEIATAAREGGTVRDIAARLGLATATAWRRLNRAKALGLVADDKSGETGETAKQAAAAETLAMPPGAPADTPRQTGETAERRRAAPRAPWAPGRQDAFVAAGFNPPAGAGIQSPADQYAPLHAAE
jgi:transposase-like protein